MCRNSFLPPPLPPSLSLRHTDTVFPSSLHAFLILITVALKTKECWTWGHAAGARHLDEFLMETPHLVQLQAMGPACPNFDRLSDISQTSQHASQHFETVEVEKKRGKTWQECRRLIYQISSTVGWCAGFRTFWAANFLKTHCTSFYLSKLIIFKP